MAVPHSMTRAEAQLDEVGDGTYDVLAGLYRGGAIVAIAIDFAVIAEAQ